MSERRRSDELAGGPVPSYTVAVRLSRNPTDDELDIMRQQNHGGVNVNRDERQDTVRFTREAESLPAAVAAIFDDISAVPDLQGYWVESDTYAP